MTCKNSIISINKGYQETMYQTYPMIFTMPEMDQYQRKHLIHDQIWQSLKICLVPYNHRSQTYFVQMYIMIYM